MTLRKERNRNTNDDSNVTTVVINSSTSTTISVANPNRISFDVNNNNEDKACWIKYQAASVDNAKKGYYLHEKDKGIHNHHMRADNIYTGEISAISDSGNITLYITEY